MKRVSRSGLRVGDGGHGRRSVADGQDDPTANWHVWWPSTAIVAAAGIAAKISASTIWLREVQHWLDGSGATSSIAKDLRLHGLTRGWSGRGLWDAERNRVILRKRSVQLLGLTIWLRNSVLLWLTALIWLGAVALLKHIHEGGV